jgi:amino acid adenylation domain-containing protein/non-ribosomal peptide synthase protein (TIGR01720 family)
VCTSLGLEGSELNRANIVAEKVLCRSVGCSDALIETKGRESGIFFLEGWEKEEGHLLSEADMLWLEKWTSVVPEQVDLCVHDLITERCRAQSDAHAVCAWDGDLTYGELDALSSVLAADLVERGVGPEVFVPLCFEKSRWTIVALVAVMKAGGAFVLLDSSQPLPRLQQLCAGVKATLVLSSSANESRSKELADNVIVLSNTMQSPSSCDLHNYGATYRTQPHHAAYASFTSGSTGEPKAVVVEHSAYCSNVLAHSDELQLSKDSRVLQLASYAFGASIVQMVTTLIVGGCVCVPSDSECRDNIAAAVRRLGVNWALFTPSILRVVRNENMSTLKHVILGGEAPARNDITAWPDHVQVIGAYGSAESSVLCAIVPNMRQMSNPQLIGKMTGSVGWVVEPDNHHKLVPLGAIGELLLEGPILARGYLNDEKKSAEAFIEAPSWFPTFCERYNKRPRRGGRMYKTGDLVQYNADGSLNLVGRKDTQVKIRGQRVELGEVEHHVQQSLTGDTSPLLVAEVVTPRGSNHQKLVIYIAIGEAANESPDQVRTALERWTQGVEDRLAERVPQYMVPSAYLAVDTIPMTATGKTDRRRLREMGAGLTLDQLAELQPFRGTIRAPITAMEKQLHELWASVLGIPSDKISADDNFLRIGGDSIAAVQLVAAAREEDLSLTVADVLNTPHLSQMARAVKAESYVEEATVAFSLLQLGIDVNVARVQAAAQCGVDIDLVEDVFPCTPLQEGMLAMTAKRHGDYIIQNLFELRVGIEPERLERAWREVVATMPILRTRVVNLAGQGLVQVVVAGEGSFTACQDLEAYLQADKQEPMGLGGPLTRFAVIDSCTDQRPVLVWTVHHALLDGWSMPLVLKQVEQAYRGRTRDRLVPFHGFIRHVLHSREGTREYWQSQLGGSEAVPFPSLPSPSYQPQADDGLDHQISGLQWPKSGITASTMVRAAWAILQGQYTNGLDVIFGATVTGRQVPVPGVERMAGPTIATVPVRVRWSWETDIRGLLEQVQAQAISMIAYEQMGLQYIRQISPDTELGCRFQTLLVVQPPPRESQKRQRTIEDVLFKAPTKVYENDGRSMGLNIMNSYAIMLECHLGADGMKLRIGFDSRVVEKVQVQRMAWHLEHVLRGMCTEQSGPLALGDVCGVSCEDLRQLAQWNGSIPARVNRCVHELVAEQCRAQPNAPAVCAWDGELTYGELDALSSALAAHLTECGVEPEVFVPLCFEKSRWTTVAMLGVMKAGGAFVLLDPSHPRARMREICQTVSAPLVVSSAANRALAAELAAAVVVVGDEETAWRSQTQACPGSAVTPRNMLYAVFTSGSTGAPKGTVIPHAAFATSAFAHGQAFHLTAESRVLQFSSYAFDASIIESLTTLLIGGCICVPSDISRHDNIAVAANELRVSVAQLTPSTARLLRREDVATLETLVLVGEPVIPSDIDQWGGRVRLVNGYGPAECSAISSVHPTLHAASEAGNIGWAAGCVCWVVDRLDHQRLMPIGAVGELLIEGPIVGCGYLNDPERTAAAFIAPPAWLHQFRAGGSSSESHDSSGAGDRLYKTGDLVQYAADGSLRFVGRKDTQVKLRGQRIELGEVEHHTRLSFPGARDVVAEVVTPAEAGRAPMLVAFVWMDHPIQDDSTGDDEEDDGNEKGRADDILAAPTDGFSAAIPEVETALHDVVPAYMVPAVFLPLRGVPLSATGKTDRRRLRDRAAALSRADIEAYHGSVTAKRSPTTPAECTIQQLWSRVLNLPPAEIGADDHFFRSGGDSIAAMKLAGVAREDGLALTVARVFQHPKLSDLAYSIQSASEVSVNLAPSPFSLLEADDLRDATIQLAIHQCRVSNDQITDIYPCTALQEGLLALTAKSAGAYIAHFSYCLPHDTDLGAFRTAWNAVARANPILNTRIIQHDQWGSFQVVVSADLPWAVYDDGERCSVEAVASFGLGEPLVHTAVIRGKDAHIPPRFILTMHHAVYDAWSLPLLLEQANAALRGNSLVARPFSPFMAYLAESNDAGEAFWRSQFTDLDTTCFPPLPTPTYVPNPTESVTYTITLPQGSTNDFTPATKIRLAWALTLAQYTDTQDVVFGLTVTGRGAPVAGIEQMTGPTIATIPLYVRLDLNATVAQALQRVQDQSTEMLAYEQTGLQKIRHLGAKAAAACQFQNLLVIQPQQDRSATGIFTEPEVRAGKGAFTTYALTLICDLGSDAVTVQATYDPQTIRAIEVQRMLYQLGHITQQISKQPGALIKDMCGVGPEDRRQLLEWNQKVPARVDRCVHALVGERCRTQLDAPAVCAWDGDFTYGELDTLSSSLAAHLVERGMGPEVFVPLYFEKSRWTTVAMLGVMKAGGAFVLLDPSHPRARMREICQTVSAPLVVSSAANRVLAAELAAVVVVVGDNEIPWRQACDACAGSFMVPDNALYAVFTSGSTGAPKGTVIPHAAFATSAFAHGQAFHLTAESRVLQFSSYAFDASIIESLTTLLIGGCVCVPSDTTRRNSIAAAANELRISVAQLTPSTARLLRPGEISTLETLVLIGEPVTSSDIDQWGGRVRLVNGYGPAECSAISSVHPTLLTALDVGNIGWAAGCVCWVVDRTDHEQLVPIGAVGELLIEGPIVGRCYLDDPERTAAAFIAPPAWLRQFRGGGSSGSHDSSGSGDRLYKTGDLVQYAADGSLRFVGRKDTQVKLRGQRIELGEVEHHTRRSFPGARDVVAEVVTPAEAGRAPMLVAFVWMDHPIQDDSTGDDEKDDGNEKNKADDILTAPTDDFRAAIPAAETALHDLVPAYMVPAVFLPLRGVPLSATGKTDRRRLRDRVATLSRADIEAYHGSATGKRSPTTPAECTLQQLWAQVLNLPADEIGADDSFFRLGGDSLTAMQLSAHLRSTGFSLHVSDIFHAKTLARLAPLLTSVHSSSLDYDDREDTPFELSPIQQLFFDLMPNGTDYFNQSFLLPVAQHLTLDVVAYAVDIIVRHHSALRTRFRRAHDGRWVQVVTASIDRSCRCQGTVVASLDEAKDVMRASHRCLNFQNGPILAVDLIEIDSKEQYLFLVAHHLVIDLVSWRVILGDLEELLQNNNLSRARPLPFQTWCRLQAEYSHETLAPAIALPSPGPPAPQGYWGSLDHQNTWGNALSSEFILNEELTAALFGAANNALRTQPVEIFQAALWHSFVHAFPNRTPPTIFNEGHGREPWDPAIDLSRTVGWFTTMWPTWITVNTSASVIDVIRHTKDARRRTPSNGWAYFASRFLNPAGRTVFEIHEPVEIAFNYVGLYQQFEREGAILQPPVRLEDHIPDVGDDVQRFALIDVSTAVERGRLRFSFHYSRHIQHQDAIRQWITHCEQSLEDAVQQLISMEPTHSLCDFPLLSLTYGSLDTLLNQTLPCSGVAPQEVEDIYPCSPMQRGLLLSQAKDTGLYQTRLLWKATPNIRAGSVDIDRLRQAWQQVIARHAILRTIFVDSESEGAGFNQVVRRSSTATTKVIEAFEAEDHSPTVILQRYPRAANRVGQPPHRLLLCATSTETYCALDINHALIDAHSSRILQRDLRLAYDGQLPAEPAPLYSDYMAYLSGFSETNAELYWRSYMDCVQPCLLPIWETDSTRTQLDKKLRSASISLGAGAHLHEFCQRHEVTLSNLFQIAWGLTLQTYTGLDTACFGYLNSGRDVPIAGVQDTVGPFINMLVCRVETDSDISVLSMLQRNQVEYLQGLPHQHCSLAGILHQANVGGRPLFNTVLSLQRPRHSEEGRDAERQCSITLETAGGEDPTEVSAYPPWGSCDPTIYDVGYDAK